MNNKQCQGILARHSRISKKAEMKEMAALEQRVAARTLELTAANQEISTQFAELMRTQERLQRSAEVQTVLREIADAAIVSASLEELYSKVHQLVQKILPAKNAYISILDETSGQILRPYSVDSGNEIPLHRAIGKGLTEYVIRSGRTVHVTPDEMDRLLETGEVQIPVNNCSEWLGAPLIDSKRKCFGVISLFLADQEEHFSKDDSEVLSIVSSHVSLAIHRKHAEQSIAESEARYRAVVEQAPEAVLLCDEITGEIIEANSRFSERFGYDLKRDGPLTVFAIIVDEHSNIERLMEEAKFSGQLALQRRVIRHRNGFFVQVERRATRVHYRGSSLISLMIRDVSEEVRREQEIHRDAQLATRVQRALLRHPEPSKFLEIDTIYKPHSYVGGDLFFMDWRYAGKLLRGFLVDAAGHGLSTALHTSAIHVLLREVNELDLPLTEQMRWLNRRAGQYFDDATFAGAIAFEIDLEMRQLRWICAGVPKFWVNMKAKQGAVDCAGLYLGINWNESFDVHTLPVEAGDSFYFLTDGLSDLLETKTEPLPEQFQEMVDCLKILSENHARRDDATAVCIRIRSLPKATIRHKTWPLIYRFNGYGDYQRLRNEVAGLLTKMTGKKHSLVEVALNEALANAMACRDGVARQHRAQLKINKVGNRLIVRVTTSRIGFAGNVMLRRLRANPETMFSFGEDSWMGRGVPIMLSTAQWMMYNSEGTELLLAWKLDATK